MHRIKVFRTFFLQADKDHLPRGFYCKENEENIYEIDDVELEHYYMKSVMKQGWAELIESEETSILNYISEDPFKE